MAKLKLNVIKVKNVNLNSKEEGFIARVITNGTAGHYLITRDVKCGSDVTDEDFFESENGEVVFKSGSDFTFEKDGNFKLTE